VAGAPTATPTPTPSPSPSGTSTPSPTTTPAPSFISSGTLSPASVAVGGTTQITDAVTSASATTALVDIEIWDPTATTKVFQVWYDNQTFSAGQTRSYTPSWSVPSGSTAGTYDVRLCVYTPAWTQKYGCNSAGLAVTAPAATPTPAPVPTAPPSSAVSALHVQGNRLLNAIGQQVQLRGVNRSGAEYACVQNNGIFEGPVDQASVNGIKSWHANVVRLPLNEQCWLGINGINPSYSGANYRNAVAGYVNLLNQNGLYVILDLHWSAPGTTLATHQVPMPDQDHSPAFWSSVASTFKGNDAVIFELFNEPWPDNQQDSDAAWTCWRDGGTCPGVSFQAAGMQTMLSSVRATGATNVVALGGVGYADYLSRWLQYKPSDPLNNLMAAWHVYTFNACNSLSCWNGAPASVIAQVPVSVTETGENQCDATWWNTLLDWLDARQTGYQAWSWSRWSSADCTYSTGYVSLSALIQDYTGTPTPYGNIYRTHLLRF